jgi:hypothetical protein
MKCKHHRKLLLVGAVATAFALPAGAETSSYELFGEQGPAAFQVTNDTYLGTTESKSMAKSQMGGVESEFSAFEIVPRGEGSSSKMERGWAKNPTAIFPDGPHITP